MAEDIFSGAVISEAEDDTTEVSADNDIFSGAKISSTKPPFDAGQYYTPPGLLQQIGVTDIDESHPIYQQLLQSQTFLDMSPSERRAAFGDAVEEANQAMYRAQGEELPTTKELAEPGATFGTQTSFDEDGHKLSGPLDRLLKQVLTLSA